MASAILSSIISIVGKLTSYSSSSTTADELQGDLRHLKRTLLRIQAMIADGGGEGDQGRIRQARATRAQGCDGSLLLDDTPAFTGEKTATPNNNSVRGFEVIDQIKSAVENACPGVVSCADILAITARDSVVTLGGPNWDVKLGRRDSKTASLTKANNDIPTPTSSLSNLISKFAAQGLSANDMVALSGAHTIGQARCTNFRDHIYNDTNIDASFARMALQPVCPKPTGSGDNNLASLDLHTPTSFDNCYYNNLISKKGLLHSDQELFNGGSTDSQVQLYGSSVTVFFSDFTAAMIKMGDISPLTGSNGEIRKNCRSVN